MKAEEVTRIVVGYDYSPIADLALRRAFELAADVGHAEVHVVTVITLSEGLGAPMMGAPVYPTVSHEEAHKTLRGRISEAVARFQSDTGESFERVVTHIRGDAPAAEIAQLATDLSAKMIIVGTHGRRGVQRLLLGSVAEGVVRMAHCEVLVVRPPEEPAPMPQIEPPCPRCVDTRFATEGKEFWCEQHRERHGQRHTYHFESRLTKEGNITGPTSVRM